MDDSRATADRIFDEDVGINTADRSAVFDEAILHQLSTEATSTGRQKREIVRKLLFQNAEGDDYPSYASSSYGADTLMSSSDRRSSSNSHSVYLFPGMSYSGSSATTKAYWTKWTQDAQRRLFTDFRNYTMHEEEEEGGDDSGDGRHHIRGAQSLRSNLGSEQSSLEASDIFRLEHEAIAARSLHQSVPKSEIRMAIVDSVEFQSLFCGLRFLQSSGHGFRKIPQDVTKELQCYGCVLVTSVSGEMVVPASPSSRESKDPKRVSYTCLEYSIDPA